MSGTMRYRSVYAKIIQYVQNDKFYAELIHLTTVYSIF